MKTPHLASATIRNSPRILIWLIGICAGIPAAIAAPHIDFAYPAGARQNQTLEITVGGRSLDGASEVWVSGDGVTGAVLEVNQPTPAQIAESRKRDEVAAQSAKIRLVVAPGATPGVRDLRIMAKEGLSNRYRFEISKLPEISEIEPNNSVATAQQLPELPLVVNGQITNADRDYFRFSAKAGQHLLFEVKARALKPYLADAVPGWFQARITLFNSDGKLLAEEDNFRFDPDPVMFFRVPADGEYIIAIWDSVSRGRDAFVYRMRIGELPYITDIFPLGGNIGNKKQPLTARGINLPRTMTVWTCDLSARPPGVTSLAFEKKGNTSVTTNSRPFEISDLPEINEREPNNSARQAQQVTPPVIINGRIDSPGDADVFRFHARAGDKLIFDVMARRLGSPLDAKIRLGPQQLTGRYIEVDDVRDERFPLITHHADPQLAHTFKKDGDYYLTIEDTQGNGGPEYAYRLRIAPQQPDFQLLVLPDNMSVPAGGNVVVQLKAIRIEDFKGPIKLRTEGLPPGFELASAEVGAGKNQSILTLAAPLQAPPGVYRPRFWAEAEIDGQTVRHPASAAEELEQAFVETRYAVPVEQGYLVVTPPAAFRVEVMLPADAGPLELVLGKDTEIPVRIIRNSRGFADLARQVLAARQSQTGKSAPAQSGKTSGGKASEAGKDRGRQNGGKQGGGGGRQGGENAQQQQQQTLAQINKQPIRVTATRGGRGMIVEAAVLESGATEGVIKVRCTNNAMVGQEGVFVIEGSLRLRATRVTVLAPALPFKVLPSEDGEPVAFVRDPASKKKNQNNSKK